MNKIYSNSEIMTSILEGMLSSIDRQKLKESNNVLEKWKSIITSIKSYVNPECGNTMYDHSKILDIKDGVILLQVDHPGYIQLFETHKKYILRGIEMKIPQLKIKNFSYKLDKKNDFNTQRDLTREEMEKIIEKQSNSVKISPENGEKKEYPPELESIFARMRESILTNDKKM